MKTLRRFGVVLYAFFIISALITHFQQYPLPAFAAKIICIIQSIGLSLLAYSLGRLLLKSIHWTSESLMTRLIVRWGIGMGSLGTIVFWLGWALPGSLSFKLMLLSVALVAVALLALQNVQASLRSLPMAFGSFSLRETIALSLVFMGAGVAFITCFSPITYYDSLVYHVALPSLYDQMDAIRPVNDNLYSFFPANIEMLFLYIFNRFGHYDEIVNLLGWTFSFVIGLQLFAWAKDVAGKKAGILALMFWWTAPCVLLLSVGAYIDIPLTFFVLMSLKTFLDAHKSGDSQTYLVAGCFAGFAVATKLTGAIGLFVLALFLLRDVVTQKRYRGAGLFLLGAVIPMAGWFLKNALSVGNPFFPFFYQWLGGSVGWTKETAAGYFQVLTEYDQTSHMFFSLLCSPWKLIHSNMKFGGGFDVLGDFGWTFFILMIPVVVALRTKRRAALDVLYFAAIYFCLWFFTKAVLRFLMPVLPLLVLLSALASAAIFSRRDTSRTILSCVLTVLLLSNIHLLFVVYHEIQPFSVPWGFESKTEFLRRRLNFYPAYEYLNKRELEPGKVLIVGEQRTYGLTTPYLASNYFAPSPLSQWCNSVLSVEQLSDKLRDAEVNFLFINERELARLGGLPRFGFDEHGAKLMQDFLRKKAVPVFSTDGTTIFRLS